MIKVAMITRATLYTVKGGDTVQVIETARHLCEQGIVVDIKLTNEKIFYADYDLLHFFNIIRPADILYHIQKSRKPYVVSTILINYSEYDKNYRKGLAGIVFRLLPADTIEYLKNIARWILGKDRLMSLSYLWKGQRASIKQVLNGAALLLPNSANEYQRIVDRYNCRVNHIIVPNGIDASLFQFNPAIEKDPLLVICVARIEGIKNQFNLIKALNGTRYRLLIIGAPSPNQQSYYRECRMIAADNIIFMGHLAQNELLAYYQKAKVHVLPSWFETTGLSSLEAAVMGCNVVITDKGDTVEYFGEHAFYCDPASPESIYTAVERASSETNDGVLRQKILAQYTWQQATAQTLKAYHQTIGQS